MAVFTVKFLGPTNTKGARMKASWGDLSFITPYDYSKDNIQNAGVAVEALAERHGLTGTWVGHYDWDGYVFVPQNGFHTVTVGG